MSELEAACRTEIIRHHEYLERWLRGTADRSELAVITDTHASDFVIIEPSGKARDKADIEAEIEAVYGAAPDVRITITDVSLVAAAGDIVVATYIERQPALDRRSTIVFRREPGHDLRWVHLHETRLTR